MKKLLLILFVCCFSSSYSQGWFPVGNGFPQNSEIFILLTYDSILYAGGGITEYANDPGNGIAQWNGSTWSPLGKGVNNDVDAIIVYNGKVYVGGQFDSAGGMPANSIASWDGHNWSPLGQGIASSVGVQALAIYNGELYVGGEFNNAGGKPIKNIARWNGTTWDSVGKGINYNYSVGCLQVYQGKLYVGGEFDSAGGVSAQDFAVWDGVKWDSVGYFRYHNGNIIFGPTSLLAYDSDLFVGGSAPQYVQTIFRWNDTAWDSIGFGARWSFVEALTEGNGKIYAGGEFDSAGHIPANEIAVWNGSTWSTLGTGMSGANGSSVASLAFYKGALYAAGYFDRAGGYNNVNNIAVWGDSALGIAQLHNTEQVNVYPNPSSGVFTITFSHPVPITIGIVSGSQNRIEIYNILGGKVYNATLKQVQGDNNINLSSQPSGVYLYRSISENGELIGEGKLVIER